MITNRYFKLGLVAMTACSLVSCMDDRYDLDDVDMTIGTSGDLTLPESSTGDILLSSFLDITEDGIVQVVDGEYFLVKDGTADVPSIDISPISINKPTLSDFNVNVDLDEILSSSGRMAAGVAGIPGLPSTTYTYTVTSEDNAYCEMSDGAIGDVPQDVIAIKEVNFMDDTRLTVQVETSFGEGYAFIDRVHLDGLSLMVPRGVHVKAAQLVHWTSNGQSETIEATDIDNADGIIKFGIAEHATMLGETHDLRLMLTFDKAVTGQEDFLFEDNQVYLKGRFEVGGIFRIESDEFNTDQLTEQQLAEIIASGSYDAVCPSHIIVHGSSAFNQNIAVASFAGTVKTKVDDIAPVEMGELPDFLNDPDVVLDLANPVFYVEVNNPMPAEARTGVTLVSQYTDGTAPISRESAEIVLPAKTKCVVCLAEKFDDLAIPEKYNGLPVVNAPIADMGALLAKLPETIDVEVSDIVLDFAQADPLSVPLTGKDVYDIALDYTVYTPLELGEGTKLIYQGVEEGIADDLEDVNKLNTKAIEIEAVAESNFPMSLTLSVDAQDADGISLVGKVVTVDDVMINAHKGPEELSYQDVKLTILPMEGHTIRELLENMDKFVYRAVAEGDGKLLDNAYLKLTKIKITLKGGVSYDAN